VLTHIDIDDEALDAVMQLSAANTKKDAVNQALQEFAASRQRAAALEHSATLAAG
jgi:Arc/MetJ family transcription regulator